MTSDLAKLALLVALYGGLGLLALIIVLIGALGVRRRASVIATASMAATCVLAQAALLYFLSDLGRAWSAGAGKDNILVAGGGAVMLLGALAIPLFVSRKLAHGDSAGPADTARAAAGAIAVFLIAHTASSLLRLPVLGAGALLRPHFWLVIAIGGAAAWGLWRHARWAWWLGLAGALWELLRFIRHVVFNPSVAGFVVLSVFGLMALIQGIVVALLLHTNSRATCLGERRSDRSSRPSSATTEIRE
jgi:translocator protein